eukprot:3599347-Ditylum_brightwellii.AAC.2
MATRSLTMLDNQYPTFACDGTLLSVVAKFDPLGNFACLEPCWCCTLVARALLEICDMLAALSMTAE